MGFGVILGGYYGGGEVEDKVWGMCGWIIGGVEVFVLMRGG